MKIICIKDIKYWIMLAVVVTCVFLANHTVRASGDVELLAVGESLQSVNTAVYSIDVEVSGTFDYAVYHAGGYFAGMGRNVASGVVSVASGDKIVITNQDSSALTVSGLNGAASASASTALRVITLNPGNSIYSESRGQQVSFGGLFDYSYEDNLTDFGRKHAAGVIFQYSSANFTNAGSLPYEVYGAYDTFDPQTVNSPALLILYADGTKNYEVNPPGNGSEGVYFRSFGSCSLDYTRYNSVYDSELIHESGTVFFTDYFFQDVLDHPNCQLYGRYGSFQPTETSEPAKISASIQPGASIEMVSNGMLYTYYASRQGLELARYLGDASYAAILSRTNDYLTPNSRIVLTNPTTSDIVVSIPFRGVDVNWATEPAVNKRVIPSGESLQFENDSFVSVCLHCENHLPLQIAENIKTTVYKKNGEISQFNGIGWFYPYDVAILQNNNSTPVTIIGPYEQFDGAPVRSGKHAEAEISKQRRDAADQEVMEADPINTMTGAHMISRNLLTLSGATPYTFKLGYNSLLLHNGILGNGWESDIEARLEVVSNDEIALHWSANRRNRFYHTENGVFVSPDLAMNEYVLVRDAVNNYTLTTHVQERYTFNSSGRMTSWSNAQGQGIQLDYDPNNRLTALTEPISGQSILFEYNAQGTVSRMTAAAGQEVLFQYDGSKRLVRITDAEGGEVRYTYNADGRVLSAADEHNNPLFANTYDAMGRVVRQSDALDNETLFRYGPLYQTTITDREGNVRRIEFDANYNLLRSIDKLGNSTEYTYDAAGNRLTATDAEGHTTTWTYDANGNVLTEQDALGNVTTMTYDEHHNLLTLVDPLGQETIYSYDANNRLTRTTDAEGNVTTYGYDSNGLIASIVYADGTTNHFQYQAGKLVSVTDASYNQIAYGYDSGNRLVTVTDAAYHDSHIQYDLLDRIVSITDVLGNATAFEYDSTGHLLSQSDAVEGTQNFAYNLNGMRISGTDALDQSITYEYDREDRLVRVTDPLGNHIDYKYDAKGRVIETTDANGNVTHYQYDKNDRLIELILPDESSVVYEYDAVGQLLSQTDTDGNATHYTYDAVGNLLSITDPLGHVTHFTYNRNNSRTTTVDPSGNATTYQYDQKSRLSKVIDALGQETAYGYDGNDRLLSVTDAMYRTTHFTYNALGQQVQTTNAMGNSQYFQYDGVGNLIGITDAKGQQILTRLLDETYRPIQDTDARGNSTVSQYDVLGRLIETTDALGRKTKYDYDHLNHLIAATDAESTASNLVFDGNGNIVRTEDPNQNETDYEYDSSDRLIRETTSAGNETSYHYNSRGLLEQVTTGRGHNISYTYDAAGNITAMDSIEGAISYQYDENDRLTSVTDEHDRTAMWEWDKLNRPISYTDEYGNTIRYAYDSVGNLRYLTYPDGKIVAYDYDDLDRLTKVTDWEGRETRYEYDENDRLLATYRPDGSRETRTYDAAGQLILLKDETALGEVIYQETYGYDAVGNVTATDLLGETQSWTSVQPAEMTYSVDNRLATYNGKNAAYDADGNMTFGPLAGNMQAYVYDSRNRLVQAGGVQYHYNAANVRTAVYEQGVTTRYVVNPNAYYSQVLMETDEQDQPKAYYIYGLGLVGLEQADGSYRTYHQDRRGSTIALSNLAGDVTDQYAYGIYGELVSREGDTPNPFLFNGRDGVMTDNNGLYYMRARYYNAEIKRFINRDVISGTIAAGQTLNRYAYVNGNPISYVDPFGLARDGDTGMSNLDKLQLLLDFGGFLPGIGIAIDITNAGISLARGDLEGAALNAGAAIPIVGDAAKAAKITSKAVRVENKLVKNAEKLVEACNCFSAGTKVLTDEGEKNIEDIEVGDKVLSKDEESGEVAYKEVTATFNHETDEIYKIHVGGQTIESTFNHPFYVKDKGWAFVKDLKVGDLLVQSDENTLMIDSIELLHKHVTVYNMTVDEFHTYFVSDLGIWVHNTNFCPDNGIGKTLLPGEGKVGTYQDLIDAGTRGDNITPHHMPSAKYMETTAGVHKNDGVSMNMEQPTPGSGGRHRLTETYGLIGQELQDYLNLSPRDALAHDIWDVRRIYQNDGLYTTEISGSLLEVISMNKHMYPNLFQK